MSDVIALHDGRVLTVHPADLCIGEYCCIHRPSNHPLRNAPLNWFDGIGMMRRCEHELDHPDPDDLAVQVSLHGLRGLLLIEAITSVHLVEENCDGCCTRTPTTKETA